MIDISIVICTFHRPAQLRRAIVTCLAQQTHRSFEIVVVDNSLEGDARPVIEGFGIEPRLVHVGLPRPNIALARNAGLAAARGELIAFLDDDQEASPGWIEALAVTMQRGGADVVFGPISPRFVGGVAPDWDPQGWRFARRLALPSGAPVDVTGAPPGSARGIGTGNSMLRRATIGPATAFASRFGQTGGEDTDFFFRLARQGCRILWCAEAEVVETVPAERATLAYMIERTRHGGRLFVAMARRNSPHPRRTAALLLARAAAQLLLWLPLMSAPARLRLRARFRVASALGKLTWWRLQRPYGRPAAAAAAA
ncbi:MAG: glycosyltransferase [Dongiaceae bacterium]